jgi:putative pyruvate formate lyase activating enzyme
MDTGCVKRVGRMTGKSQSLNYLNECRLCPRECAVNRSVGETGFCAAGNSAEIYRYGPHHGEEPVLSGTSGSGTVFFSRCTLGCIYCQNHQISQQGEGEKYSIGDLADMMETLFRKGCHNWNFVSPTPWMPMIKEALGVLSEKGIELPVVYNTSGYERTEIIAELKDTVDVWLTDLRYSSDKTALEGSGVSDYVSSARSAFKEMWKQSGSLVLADDGTAVKGLICRLLILPGHADEAVANLKWISEAVSTDVALSVMAQYTPTYKAIGNEPWNRRVTRAEYDLVADAVEQLGFSMGWMQEFEGSCSQELAGFRMKPGYGSVAGS